MTTSSGEEAESDSERVCANSARMASAMALPSMTLPREEEDVVSEEEEDDIIILVNTVVVMHVVDDDDDDDDDDVGLDGRMLLRR